MDNRRLLLAVILSMGVLFGWSYFFAPEPVPKVGPEIVNDSPEFEAVDRNASTSGVDDGRRGLSESAESNGLEDEAEGDSSAFDLPATRPSVAAAGEERIRIATDLAEIELSNRGGQLVSYRLHQFQESENGVEMNLVRERLSNLYPYGLTQPDGSPSPLNDALFVVERPTEGEVVFRYSGPLGSAEKHFRFQKGGLIEVTAEVDGGDFSLFLGPGLRNPPVVETENRLFRRRVVYMGADEDVEEEAARKVSPGQTIPAGGLRWVGLDDTYFLTAFIPLSPLQQVAIDPVLVDPALVDPAVADQEPDESQVAAVAAVQRILPGQEIPEDRRKEPREVGLRLTPTGEEVAVLSYWGPKSYDYLASFDLGLEKTVNLGIFRPLARVFMIGLQWIYANVVHNYGWAIVLMTIAIKIVLLPITVKHAGSMRKMQGLNPKVQAVRQRWAGKLKDKQGKPNLEAQRKMNEEVMATYRAAGVNPAGGCLPMLLQIPVFWAFYKLLYESIELRHAPWEMWITDLSAKDPYYILPIVMGASQLLQQRLMPMPSANPLQRRMMAMMPIVFTFFFLQFPAGLVLYWLTNNLTTIIQQVVINRLKKPDEEEGAIEITAKQRRKTKASKAKA